MLAGEAHLGVEVASSLWSLGERLSSIRHRDLLTIFYALQYFLPFGRISAVAVSADNTTALAFLRNQGGTRAAVFGPDGSWSSALGGVPFHLSSASVHHGAQLVLSSQSNSEFRVDPETDSVSAASEKVAGVTRPVHNLTNSPLLTLFFSVPQFQCSWDRGSSQTRSAADNHCSLLAPEALVSGASGAGSRRSGGSASGQGSVEPASCSSTASGSV